MASLVPGRNDRLTMIAIIGKSFWSECDVSLWDDWSLYTGPHRRHLPRLTFESIRNPTGLLRSLLGKSLLTQQGPQGGRRNRYPCSGDVRFRIVWWGGLVFEAFVWIVVLSLVCSGPGSGYCFRDLGPPGPLHFDSGVKIHC